MITSVTCVGLNKTKNLPILSKITSFDQAYSINGTESNGLCKKIGYKQGSVKGSMTWGRLGGISYIVYEKGQVTGSDLHGELITSP
jgi:hypothetical protein